MNLFSGLIFFSRIEKEPFNGGAKLSLRNVIYEIGKNLPEFDNGELFHLIKAPDILKIGKDILKLRIKDNDAPHIVSQELPYGGIRYMLYYQRIVDKTPSPRSPAKV